MSLSSRLRSAVLKDLCVDSFGRLLYLYTMVFVLLRVVWREYFGGPGAMSESFMIEAVGGLQGWLLRLLYGR